MSQNKVIFISYSRHDSLSFARKLSMSLQREGYFVFLDVEEITIGDNWQERLREALSDATHLIAVLTPHSVASKWCNLEWDVARQLSIPILPILYVDCEKDVFMSEIQHADFRNSTDYEKNIVSLVRAIEKAGGTHNQTLTYWKRFPVINLAPHPDRVRCISPDTSIARAHHIISEEVQYAFRHLLVTDTGKNGGKLLGIIALRNLLKDINNPSINIATKTVNQLMIRFDTTPRREPNCVWLQNDSTIESAIVAFNQPLTVRNASGHYFYMSAIPIVDEDNHSVTIISFKDILRAMIDRTIPIPPISIEQVPYLRGGDVVNANLQDEPIAIKARMSPLGQRDVPIVDNSDNNLLVGLVPDHILITSYHKNVVMGNIMTPIENLKLQTPKIKLENMLKTYLAEDDATIYYSFPVVSSRDNPQFLGLIGYRDIFKSLMDM